MRTLKLLFLTIMLTAPGSWADAQTFSKDLQKFSDNAVNEFDLIEKDRKAKLNKIANHVYDELKKNYKANALFICTHNSRRSHMASLWFQAGAYYYGLTNVESYSGGTEATAFNPRAVAALERAGFTYSIEDSSTKNIVYNFEFGDRYPEKLLFSKKFSDENNPQKDFFAVMVCSDADQSCPFVPGADKRFAIPYTDPRYSDNTASETTTYDQTCRLIAREMFYLANRVKIKMNEYHESTKK